jgi:hypothetical protein
MPLPELPEAITARVVPVGYTHIALLLYGDTDVAHTKRISSWRRSDPEFPPALTAGRSPTFDAKGVWQWLARKARSSDGRTQASLRDMTQLQPNTPGAAAMRHWLLAGLAMRYITGDAGTRRWMTSLAALAAVSRGDGVVECNVLRLLPPPATAQSLLVAGADPQMSGAQWVSMLAAELPARPVVDPGAHTPNPLVALADATVPVDLRTLAAQAAMSAPPHDLPRFTELILAGDDGSSSHVDATSTSPEATQFIVGLVEGAGERLGRTWTTAYDPASGEGHLLAALATRREGRRWTLYGQDADTESLQLAAARLLTTGAGFDVRLTDDTIEHDQFRDLTVDVVVADPPQPTRRLRTHDHMDDWWQHVLEKLADEQSMAFVLTSDQVQAQPSDELIASGHVLAVIETGQRLRRDTPGHSVLWVLSPQRLTRTVRVAVTEKRADWLSPLLEVAVEAVVGAVQGASLPAASEPGIQVWSVLATDADVLRPVGEESWPMPGVAPRNLFTDILDRPSVRELRARLLEALNALPQEQREREITSLVDTLTQARADVESARR